MRIRRFQEIEAHKCPGCGRYVDVLWYDQGRVAECCGSFLCPDCTDEITECSRCGYQKCPACGKDECPTCNRLDYEAGVKTAYYAGIRSVSYAYSNSTS